MTAFTSVEAAVQMMKEGATDYVAKPWDDDKLVLTVEEDFERRADGRLVIDDQHLEQGGHAGAL
ncbi:MAG TPA: hypothetical protein VGI39_14005 [Polyangiaceae bacterium]